MDYMLKKMDCKQDLPLKVRMQKKFQSISESLIYFFIYFFPPNNEKIMLYGSKIKYDLLQCDDGPPLPFFFKIFILRGVYRIVQKKKPRRWRGKKKKK